MALGEYGSHDIEQAPLISSETVMRKRSHKFNVAVAAMASLAVVAVLALVLSSGNEESNAELEQAAANLQMLPGKAAAAPAPAAAPATANSADASKNLAHLIKKDIKAAES